MSSLLRRPEDEEEGRFYLCTHSGEFKKTRWTEAGVERTKQDLEAALRRAKQLAKAEREWEAKREEARAALAAREAGLQAAQARLEEMVNRTVDAILLLYDREHEAARSPDGSDGAKDPSPEELTDSIMKSVVAPLLDGPSKSSKGGRKNAAAKPIRVKRSRPAKGKQQQQQTAVESQA